MGINYHGPISLKETVENAYKKIAHLYTRENPTIQSGKIISVEYDGVNPPNFELDGMWCRDINQTIKSLMGTVKGKGSKRKVIQWTEHLKELSHKGYYGGGNKAGFYHIHLDTVFFSPSLLYHKWAYDFMSQQGVCFLIPYETLDKLKEGDQFLKHELVHWDLGNTEPINKLRTLTVRYMTSNYNWLEVLESIRKDTRNFPTIPIETRREILDIQIEGPLSLELDLFLLDTKMQELDFDLINEGLAYAVTSQSPNFSKYTDDASEIEKMERAYKHFKETLKTKNQRDIIIEVKKCINESFSNNRNIFDLLGI